MNFLKKIISIGNDFQVRLLTHKTVALLIPYIKKDETVLDIGSGLGFQAAMIAKKQGNEIKGIDVVDYSKTEIPYKHFDGLHIPYEDKFFDVSYLSFVLHHAADPIQLLKEARRVTKKRIIILEDTPRNIFDRLVDMYHGWSFNKFYGIKDKPQFRSKTEWEEEFKKLGIINVDSELLSRFVREPYFPISRSRFVLHLS